jgi:hypothetical protein
MPNSIGIEGHFRNKYIHLVYKISPCPSLPKRGILGSMTSSCSILQDGINSGRSTTPDLGWPDQETVSQCHPELVSVSHVFVTIRNYEILNQVQNDNLHSATIATQLSTGESRDFHHWNGVCSNTYAVNISRFINSRAFSGSACWSTPRPMTR